MILSFSLTTGGSIGLDRDSIWKVDGTGYGSIISVGTDTYSVTETFSEVVAASTGSLVEVVSNGNTIALNLGMIQRVYEDGSGNAVLILKNRDTHVVDLSLAEVVALQNAGFGDVVIETTGTITGTDAVLVPCFPIPDTNAYSISGSVIVKCTDAGGGTVVVGETFFNFIFGVPVNSSAISGDDYQNSSSETSMTETVVEVSDINSGQLRISITPPFDTADATSEFSYKIRLSGFSL